VKAKKINTESSVVVFVINRRNALKGVNGMTVNAMKAYEGSGGIAAVIFDH
jgi:hypothetical protein